MNTAPAYVMRVDDAPRTPDFPYMVVRCKCGDYCYALVATLEVMQAEGFEPEYVCRICAPPAIREAAEEVMARHKEMGIPGGAVAKVMVEDEEQGGIVH